MQRFLLLVFGCWAWLTAGDAAAAKLAVTDLSYEDRVAQYFHSVNYHNRSSQRESGSEAEQGGPYRYSGRSRYAQSDRSETDYAELESSYSYLQYGELHKFTGDIKGEILKSGRFDLVQAKPVTGKKNDQIFDIIRRIKQGHYPSADYVLFGTLSAIDFRDEQTPVIGTNSLSRLFGLTLTAEFSLINTRNYQVTAAFSAIGEGQDVRMIPPGGHAVPSRAKVVAQVSKSLGEDVARQLGEQLGGDSSATGDAHPADSGSDANVQVYPR